MPARILLLPVALLGIATAVAGPAEAADRGHPDHPIPMAAGPNGAPVVDVHINGRLIRMIVDTGSTHTSISARAAADLGAPIVAKSAVLTSAGEALLPIARLDRLALAGRTAMGVLATVLEQDVLDPSGAAAGIVGQDVLASSAYTLDFAGCRFFWQTEIDPAGRGISLTLEEAAGRFVASVPQREGTLRLVPDSGAEALVLFSVSARRRWQPPGASGAWIETVAGRAPAMAAVLPRFEVGGATLRNVNAAFLPERAGDTGRLDGLLPLSLFGRVTIDAPGRRLLLGP
jgi:predicted aspartyl protease